MRGRILLAVVLCATSGVVADTINIPVDYPTIQQGIAAAVNGDEIVVAPGIYNEAINFLGKEIVVLGAKGQGATTINAAGFQTSVVTCTSGETANSVLNGFTLTGGQGTIVVLVNPQRVGGGMYVNDSSPTVMNCRFFQNFVADQIANEQAGGGGVYITGLSSPSFQNCMFEENGVTNSGGGAHVFGGASPEFIDCLFSNNTAGDGGGLIVFSDPPKLQTTATLINCVISDNTHGGMRINYSSPTITNCLFESNTTEKSGGGINNTNGSSPIITNTKFCNNFSLLGGGGLAVSGKNSNPILIDCDFSQNNANQSNDGGGGIYAAIPGTIVSDSRFCDNHPDHLSGPIGKEGVNCFTQSCFDLDCNGFIGIGDLLILLSSWGSCSPGAGCLADIDCNTVVNINDLLLLLSDWG